MFAGIFTDDGRVADVRVVPTLSPRTTRRLAGFCTVIGLAAAVACGQPQREPPIRVGDRPLVRLEAEEPQQLFDPTDGPPEASRTAGWKISIGHEVRSGRPVPPGSTVSYSLKVAGDCELHLAYGVPAEANGPVLFRAVIVDADGVETELVKETVGVGGRPAGQWIDTRADLARWRGRDVVLDLETSTDRSTVLDRATPFWATPRATAPSHRAGDGLDLLVISVDTLRAGRMSLYGYDVATTPMIDAWARARAAVFTTVVAPSPWTLPSHVSLFTGLEAVRHGVNHDVGGIRAKGAAVSVLALDMMAERLARAGYETAAFTGGAYVDPRYGFAQGFDRFASWPDRSKDAHELEVGVDRVVEWLAAPRAAPRFAFLHTYAVHDPYRVRHPYFERVAPPDIDPPNGRIALMSPKNDPAKGFQQQNRFVFRRSGGGQRELVMTDDNRRLVGAMYDAGVAYADAEIGRLLDELGSRGLDEQTIVVLTSDHGESLGDHGQAGHIFLTDDNLLVPLVIAVPDRLGAGRVIDRQVRLVDVLPTVLDLLGLDADGDLDGVSLTPLMAGESNAEPAVAWSYSAAANRGLAMRVDGRLKYIVNNTAWAPVAGDQQLYDLTEDPGEEHNLAAGADQRMAELRRTAMAVFNARAVGLRLRIQSGNGHLTGTLRGPAVRPVGTKAIGLGAAEVTSDTIGEARLDVPPGESFELHFEKVFGWRLKIDGRFDDPGGSTSVRHTFDVRNERDVESLIYDGSTWRTEERRLGENETGLSVQWRGVVGLGGPSAAAIDKALADQLRALGYVR